MKRYYTPRLEEALRSNVTPKTGAGPERNHQTGMNRCWIETRWIDQFVDRYWDEPNWNYRDGCLIPSRPTIYRDGTRTDRNGMGWDKRDDTSRI
ncbi:hypothetical protein H5410_028114 [Solanum commersonii]|uniref:Uncharacterized protein n=1 Tax=Solanum commersonii TaxID=4109 RepID=A0A9J5Z6J3_SOLCO|nr:hypothetical protein H5410_028114 [Solanum commersonii]